MRVSPNGVRILVATEPVDFRKGHDGLAAVVQNELGLDPYSGVAYVFRAKRADRIKVLWFDGTGLALAYKRLEGRAVCLACGSPRRHPAHPGAVRGLVRGSGTGAGRGHRGCAGRGPRPDVQDGIGAPGSARSAGRYCL